MGVPSQKSSDQNIMEHKCIELSNASEQAGSRSHKMHSFLAPKFSARYWISITALSATQTSQRNDTQCTSGKYQFAGVIQGSMSCAKTNIGPHMLIHCV